MKKEIIIAVLAASALCAVFFMKYCTSETNELREKLDQIYVVEQPNLQFASSVLSLRQLCSELHSVELGTNTNWELVAANASQLQTEISRLPASQQRSAEQLQRNLGVKAQQLTTRIKAASQAKIELQEEIEKPDAAGLSALVGYKDVAAKEAAYSAAIEAVRTTIGATQADLSDYGRTLSEHIAWQVAQIEVGRVDPDDQRAAFEDFSEQVTGAITGASTGTAAEPETLSGYQTIFGNGLSAQMLEAKFESRQRRRQN